MERWNGRVALVTGASVGIGAEVCRELVKHGMTVIGCSRSVDKIQKIADEDGVRKSAGKLIPVRCDLNHESEILSMFEDIRKRFGRLDVCINNAGLGHHSPLLTGTTADWQNMLNVNVLALCICTREAVKLMRDGESDEGHVIHISSMGGHRLSPMSGATFYCGTKFMVGALTEGLRKELKEANANIRISSISPGMVQTEFFDNYLKNDPSNSGTDIFQNLKALQPQDIANSVTYILASPPHVEVHDILVRPTEQKT